jgi:ribosomal protein S18 acetylase RimI-like enzyme
MYDEDFLLKQYMIGSEYNLHQRQRNIRKFVKFSMQFLACENFRASTVFGKLMYRSTCNCTLHYIKCIVFAILLRMSLVIREYRESDREGLVRCLGLLQDHIASIDPLHRIRRLKDFDIDMYVARSFEEVQKHDGAVFIAEDKEKMIGCIIGVVHKDGPEDIERYPSINGKIIELIVLPEYRGQRVGNELMQRMEQYLASKNCDVITVECFAPNEDAYQFYKKMNYMDREHIMIKSIKKP